MGRPLRIFIPGYAYHVVARGNERKNIFRDDWDKRKFLNLLEEAKEKFQLRVLSYVLMSNHYHILIEINVPNLSQAMQFVNSSYSIYFNRKYVRSGHLLQGRFVATLVEHGQAVKFVTAYIHLNPARAFMVKDLKEYEWSSHRQYTGAASKGTAEPELVLKYFSENYKESIMMYEKYLEETAMMDDSRNKAQIYGDYVIGSEGFVRDIKLIFKDKKIPSSIIKRRELKKVYDQPMIIEAVMDYYKVSKDNLLYKKSRWNKGKGVLMYLLKRDAGMTFADIGVLFGGLDSSGIGRICKKIKIQAVKGKEESKAIASIEKLYK